MAKLRTGLATGSLLLGLAAVGAPVLSGVVLLTVDADITTPCLVAMLLAVPVGIGAGIVAASNAHSRRLEFGGLLRAVAGVVLCVIGGGALAALWLVVASVSGR